jgi:hypothetical protein
VFALFHQLKVTLPELEPLLPPVACAPPDVLVEPPPLLQAAAKAVAAASATAASARFVFMLRFISPGGSGSRSELAVAYATAAGPRPVRKFQGILSMVPSS